MPLYSGFEYPPSPAKGSMGVASNREGFRRGENCNIPAVSRELTGARNNTNLHLILVNLVRQNRVRPGVEENESPLCPDPKRLPNDEHPLTTIITPPHPPL